MPAYKGTVYAKTFTLKSKSTGLPLNLSGWTFEAMFRRRVQDDDPLLTISSGTGELTLPSGGSDGKLQMVLTAEQTELLPLGYVVFDVTRLNSTPAPTYLFGGKFRVSLPVTRS